MVSALFPAAFYYCLRNRKGALLSLMAPALGVLSVLGHNELRDHGAVEALVMYSVSVLSVSLLVAALRPEVVKQAATARTGKKYEAPKWRINLYAVLTLTLALGLMVLLLA
ncbi:hypothetical protein [Streptomyces sp. NPDC058632]|uniref:hypothetical protein n=1 Tax=unclassified Streptomyces TaxID=2593676 RepID=UPI0036544C17